MKKTFYLFYLLPYLTQAQNEILHFERINGLSQNTVFAITKDKQGFLWMATADGLNRYDGVKMKYYKPSVDGRRGTYTNQIIRTSLLEDSSGQIWFSSGAGLYTYDKKKDFFEQKQVRLSNNTSVNWSIDPLFVDGHHFWGANGVYGVFEYDIRNDGWTGYPVSQTSNASLVLKNGIKDDKNNFWFLAREGILFFDRNKKSWSHLFKDRHFIGLGAGPGVIFLTTDKQLYISSINQPELKIIHADSPTPIFSIKRFYTDRKMQTWAGDDMGNIYFRANHSNRFIWRGNINGTNSGGSAFPTYSLFVDDNDILWVGADVSGLLKASIAKPFFNILPPLNNLGNTNMFIHCIHEEGDDIWLGTFRMGLLKYNKKTGVISKVKLPFVKEPRLDNNSISLFYQDSHKNLWIGAYTGLFVRPKNTYKFLRIDLPKPQHLIEVDIRPLTMKECNDTLILASQWGIHKIIRSGIAYTAPYADYINSGYYYDIFIDREKNFWLASEMGILKVKQLDRKIGRNTGDTLLFKNTNIKSFLHDTSLNLLWISSTSGLIAYHLATGKYKTFTEADGLGNSYVYGALKNNNELWLSTNKGLSRAVIQIRQGEVLPALTFTNFTKQDGLPDDEFNTGAMHRGVSGDFYFGSVKGVARFKPGKIDYNRYVPTIVMTSLLINDEIADSTTAPEYISSLSLPYQKNNLFFSFRGIEYVNPARVQYAYMLEGWDKNWIYSGSLNEVRYNNLPHGHYTFKVKAANGSGIWNENIYSVSLIIHPPFWKTGWFYTLSTILVLITIIFITRFFTQQKLKTKIARLEKEKELEKERQRISREMHDDIGAGLTQIALMSESAKTKHKAGELDEIAQTSRQLVNNMSEIIWSLNPENKTLEHLLSYMREQLGKQLEYSGIKYSLILPDTVKNINLTNEQRRNILLATKEMVNNAIKHSMATEILVQGEVTDGQFTCSVEDNGRGFDLTYQMKGNGLKNIRHRVEESGGKFEIQSKPGKGSRLTFNIPIKSTT